MLCLGLIFTVCWEWRSLSLSFTSPLNRRPSFSSTVRCWCCCCFFHFVHTVNRIKAGIADGCTENVVAICIAVAVADSVIVVGAKQFFSDCARANGLLATWHSVSNFRVCVCWFAQFSVCGCVDGVLLLLFASIHLLLLWHSYALTEQIKTRFFPIIYILLFCCVTVFKTLNSVAVTAYGICFIGCVRVFL